MNLNIKKIDVLRLIRLTCSMLPDSISDPTTMKFSGFSALVGRFSEYWGE